MWKIKYWSFGGGNYFDTQICIMPTLCKLWLVSYLITLVDDWVLYLWLAMWEFDPIMPLDYFLEWSAWFCELLLSIFLSFSLLHCSGTSNVSVGGSDYYPKVSFYTFKSLCFKHFCVVILHLYSNWHVKDLAMTSNYICG